MGAPRPPSRALTGRTGRQPQAKGLPTGSAPSLPGPTRQTSRLRGPQPPAPAHLDGNPGPPCLPADQGASGNTKLQSPEGTSGALGLQILSASHAASYLREHCFAPMTFPEEPKGRLIRAGSGCRDQGRGRQDIAWGQASALEAHPQQVLSPSELRPHPGGGRSRAEHRFQSTALSQATRP